MSPISDIQVLQVKLFLILFVYSRLIFLIRECSISAILPEIILSNHCTMKFFDLRILFTCALVLAFMTTTFAQDLELPRKSPKASISYTIGLTDITVNYSSPSVNDRDIFGALVPWGKLWRAGANEATTVEFSTDVMIERKPLAAGKYSLFLIPNEDGKWVAVFNKVADQWGAYEYDEAQDALRVEITTKKAKVLEKRLNYSIVDQAVDKGYIRFGWANWRAYIRLRVEVMDQAIANVESALEKAGDDRKWVIYAQAADFLMESDKHQDKALEMAKKSTDLFSHSWNWYTRAKVEAKTGDFKNAVASAKKASEVGAGNADDNFYKDSKGMIEASIAEWEAKVQP
jgi:tetratricopeptide (TPR) repeat protein